MELVAPAPDPRIALARTISEEALGVAITLVEGPFYHHIKGERSFANPVLLPSTPTWESVYRSPGTPPFDQETAVILANAMEQIRRYRELPGEPLDFRTDTVTLFRVFERYESARQATLAPTLWALYALHRKFGTELPHSMLQVIPYEQVDGSEKEMVSFYFTGTNLPIYFGGRWPTPCTFWTHDGPFAVSCNATAASGGDKEWSHRSSVRAWRAAHPDLE